MNRFKNQIVLALGFAIVAGVISGITAAPAIAQAIKAALIKNVDERGRIPYQKEITNFSSTLTVPAGKRLVIEHVAGRFVHGNPGTLLYFQLTTGAITEFMLPQLAASDSGATSYVLNSPARLYVEPNTVLSSGNGVTFGTGTVSYNVVVAGYLVDLSI